MLVPVRVFDDDLDLWIDRLGRLDDELARRLIEKFQTMKLR